MANSKITLYSILALFILPLGVAVILYLSGYTGHLQNKGQWVNNTPAVHELVTNYSQESTYHWTVLIPCEKYCPEEKMVRAGISTLGVKSNLVEYMIVTPTQMTLSGISQLNMNQIYLADPKQNILLQYDKDNIMDMVLDLKKLLKPVEKRS